jgi:hypothetical protein
LAKKMKFISRTVFLRDFAAHGIALDSRYSPPQTLVFEGAQDMSWSWDMPGRIKDLPRWISALVDATRADKNLYLFPRDGAWTSGDSLKTFLMGAIFSVFGLKPTGDEVVVAEEAERDAVESLFFLSLVHGGTVSDDVFLIPDHAKVILYADHHEAVHAEFANPDFMNHYLPESPELV